MNVSESLVYKSISLITRFFASHWTQVLTNALTVQVKFDFSDYQDLGRNFWKADLNQAARAADATREASGAVYGEQLK